MVFLKANVPGVGIAVSLLWSWIPVVNPLMTIIVVKSYRKSVIHWLGAFKLRSNAVYSTNIAVSSTGRF